MTSLFIYYYDWAQAWKVDLGNQVLRLGDISGLSEYADNLDAGTAGLRFDDPNATIGHSSDAILGLKVIGLDETAAPVGNRRLYTGLIGDRKYSHSTNPDGSLRLGSARIVDIDLHEINSLANNRLIRQSDTAAKRPAESVGDRLTWILASTYLSDLVVDGGLVVYPPAPIMDANDYRQQRPVNVIEDCAIAGGYTAFLYHDDERWTKARLFFDDFLRSTAYASTLRLSNVLADRDSGVEIGVGATGTFASGPATLTRSPERVYSGVSIAYRKGTTFRTKSSTATAFIERDGVAPNANVKSLTRANAIGDRFLNENRTEYDLISTSVELPVAQANAIRRGHRIDGKWSHLPGYASFTTCRVISRSISTPTKTDDRYRLDLVLTPTITAGACNPATATNLALTATVAGYTDGPTSGGSGGNTYLTAPTNVTRVNDGLDTPDSEMTSTLIDPAYRGQTFHRGWTFDFGGTVGIGFIDVRKTVSDTWPDTFEYFDGAWNTLSPIESSFTDGTTLVTRETFTPVSCSQARVTFSVFAGGGLPLHFSFDARHGVGEIRILECTV